MLCDDPVPHCAVQLTHSTGKVILSGRQCRAQTLFFRAATAKALTMVLAGLAFTRTSLPKAMRLPALVAGLCLVLIMQTPGITNLPVPFTSLLAISAKASSTLLISDLFFSTAAPRASAMAPLLMDLAPFMAFMPFMAFIAFFAIVAVAVRRMQGKPCEECC